MGTERQKKVAKIVSENIRHKNPKNKGEILKESGYPESTSKRPSQVFESKGVKEILKPIIEQLEAERQRAIKAMAGKISKAKYRDLTDNVDKMTKNIELLSGRPTENVNIPYENEQLRKIADRVRGRGEDGQSDGAE